jgi:hypothetical protein
MCTAILRWAGSDEAIEAARDGDDPKHDLT